MKWLIAIHDLCSWKWIPYETEKNSILFNWWHLPSFLPYFSWLLQGSYYISKSCPHWFQCIIQTPLFTKFFYIWCCFGKVMSGHGWKETVEKNLWKRLMEDIYCRGVVNQFHAEVSITVRGVKIMHFISHCMISDRE